MSQRGGAYGLFGFMLLVSAVCMGLGVWQGRRLAARRSANQVALTARALPEVDLNADVLNQALIQRRVRARGEFDHDHSFVLRGRVEREVPGVQLVVPLRLSGRNEAVLVNRGFVPAPDAARPDPGAIDRSGEAQVTGLALQIPESADSGSPLTVQGSTTWRRLDLAAIRRQLPYPVLEVYLHQTEPDSRPEGGAAWPRPAMLPELDDGPHLSYMIQWFGIGAAALVFAFLSLGSRSRPKTVEGSRRPQDASERPSTGFD